MDALSRFVSNHPDFSLFCGALAFVLVLAGAIAGVAAVDKILAIVHLAVVKECI